MFLIALSFSFFAIFYLVMQDKDLQQRILVRATQSFSKQIGSKASVKELEWGFPNSFILKDVYIEDKQKDTLLSVERAKVTINIWPLIRSQVSFRTIQFKGMDLRIRQMKDTTSYNYDFLVEALTNPNDTTEMNWTLDIESLGFTDCKVSAVQNNPGETVDGVINFKDLHVSDLSGILYVKNHSEEETELRLIKLQAKERSGLVLSDLTTNVLLNDEVIRLDKFVTQMPSSKLGIDHAVLYKYDKDKWFMNLDDNRVDFLFQPSYVNLGDLAPLVPVFNGSEESVSISGSIAGTKKFLSLEDFKLAMGETMKVDGNFDFSNLSNLDSLGIRAKIDNVSLSADDVKKVGGMILQRSIYLPSVCDSLGILSYSGEVEGTFRNVLLSGNLRTDAGTLATNVYLTGEDSQFNKFNVIGQVSTHGFDLSQLVGPDVRLKKTTFDLEVDLKKVEAEKFQLEAIGKIDSLDFRDYIFQGIALNGKFDEKGFNGNFTLTDDNIHLDFEGNADLRKSQPVLNFNARVTEANLQKLNWKEGPYSETVSFDIQANCTGLDFDNLEGYLSIDNFLYTRDDKMLYLNVFTVNTMPLKEGGKQFNVISDYVNGHFDGEYSFSSLVDAIKRITYTYVPTLADMDRTYSPEKSVSKDGRNNKFKFDFTLENTEPINDVIELPFIMQQKCHLSGFVNDSIDKYSLRLEAPLFSYNDIEVENALLLLENPKECVKLVCRSTYYNVGERRNPYFLSLNSTAKDDNIDVKVSYSNSQAITNSGTFSLSSKLLGYSPNGLSADFVVNPSKIIVKDTTWNIHKGTVSLRPNLLVVDSLKASNVYQKIQAQGKCTDSSNDSLRIWFTDLDLDSFSKLLASPGVTFGGVGDGDFYLTKLFTNPTVEGRLGAYDAYLNDYPFGDLDAQFAYDKFNNVMVFGTSLVTAMESHKQSQIDGAVFFNQDSLFIDGYLRDIDMRFLRLYLDGVLSSNTGVLNTHVKALGRYDRIGLEGLGLVKDFGFDIEYTNTHYNLTDTVIMTQNSFRLPGVTVTDDDGNKAKLNALIMHKGFFDWKYAMNIETDRLMAFNTTEHDNDMFYGKVYVGGNVSLSGTSDFFNVDVNAKSMKGSNVTIPLDGRKDAKDANFITYRSRKSLSQDELRQMRRKKKQQIKEQNEKSSLDMIVNVELEATPDAEVVLITDKKLGDEVRTRGHGNLTMKYTSSDDAFKLNGTYQIDRGDYQFTIQSVIARKFELLEGSTVRWNGDPTAAILDLNAKYSLNAYIGDILADDNVSNTQVNCLMGVSGTISRPNIKFDLDMPNIDEDMMRKVKSVINTEEAMNRNVATLLAFGTFNTSDVTTSSSNSGLSNVGFAALSSEISGLLSKINRDVNIGLNYRPYTGDQTQSTTEFEVALSTGLFHDRLQLNGNFGYREGFSTLDATNTQSGIVDFDIEYKLSKNGRFRSKAFNRSSNSYLRNYDSKTQGIGLLYRQDYDSASELLKTYLSPFTRINQRIEERRNKKEESK